MDQFVKSQNIQMRTFLKKMTHIQSFLDKTYSNGSGKQPCCQIILILSVKGYDLQNKQVPVNFYKQDLQHPFFSNFDFVNFDILSAIREVPFWKVPSVCGLGQTWDLSKNLHDRIFKQKILLTKSA